MHVSAHALICLVLNAHVLRIPVFVFGSTAGKPVQLIEEMLHNLKNEEKWLLQCYKE